MVSKSSLPRISLVTPSFNQGRYLEQTILSVLLQDYANLDYAVIDGGSEDESVEIIRRYVRHLSYWKSEKDRGQADALATGFSRASGDIYGWLNSDDILLPGALKAIGEFFASHPSVGVVYGNRIVIDEDGNEIGRQHPPTYIPSDSWGFGQQMCQEAVFWRREAYELAGGINPDWFFIMDFDLFYRMSRIAAYSKLKRYLGCMRIHASAKSTKHDAIMWEEFEKAKIDLKISTASGARANFARFLVQQLSRYERISSKRLSSADYVLWRNKLQARPHQTE